MGLLFFSIYSCENVAVQDRLLNSRCVLQPYCISKVTVTQVAFELNQMNLCMINMKLKRKMTKDFRVDLMCPVKQHYFVSLGNTYLCHVAFQETFDSKYILVNYYQYILMFSKIFFPLW